MSKWNNWKQKLKTAEGIMAMVLLIPALLLSGGLYTAMYNVPGTEEAIADAAADYLEMDITVLDQVKKGRGMVVTFMTDEEASNIGGTVTFKRGLTFLWMPVSASWGPLDYIVDTKVFSDYRLLKPQDHTVVYALDCPEGTASWSIDYYDPVAYTERGEINLLTMEGNFEGTHFAQYVEEAIDWGYIHDRKYFDEKGKETENSHANETPGNGWGSSRTTAEIGLWEGICFIILLLGVLGTKSLLKQAGGAGNES